MRVPEIQRRTPKTPDRVKPRMAMLSTSAATKKGGLFPRFAGTSF
jgi:hypothetical protein